MNINQQQEERAIKLAIDNTICDHPPSRIKMDGVCLDCGQKVMKYDCDCGICNFCCPNQSLS